MRRILLVLFLLIIINPCAHAVIAYPWPVEVKLPDGSSITVKVNGDEFAGFTTTTDGYRVTRASDGFYYYETSSMATKSGVTTGLRANDPARRTAAERAAMGGVLRELTTIEMANGQQLRQSAASLYKAPSDAQTKTKAAQQPAKLLVLMVQFSDTKFTAANAKQAITNIFNQSPYMGIGSVKDYYNYNSSGAYNPTFDVFGVVTMPNKSSYYAANDMKYVHDMVADACRALSGSVNFADYDCDNDGVVDNVYVVFAGYNQAEGGGSQTIWPHAADVRYSGINVTLNGKRLGPYACGSEFRLASGGILSGVGTFCHEFAHILGLMDMYDTDAAEGGGSSVGLFNISLMSTGNYNNSSYMPPSLNAYERYSLGWLELPDLMPGSVILEAINKNKGYKITTDQAEEYFVLEVRDNTGWDAAISTGGVPFQGLVIYQVDKSERMVNGFSASKRWAMNAVNTYPGHMCMRLRPASNHDNQRDGAPYPGTSGNNAFTRLTTPAAVSWNNVPLGVELSNIAYSAMRATFTVRASQVYRSVQGSIVDQDSKPLPNVLLRLAPSGDTKSGGGLSLLYLANDTKATNAYVVITDAAGRYNFTTVPEGEYTLTASLYGYQPWAQQIVLGGDNLVVPKIMMPTSAVALASLVSHFNGMPMAFLSVDELIDGIKMHWTADMVAQKGMVGDVINNIYWNTGFENKRCKAQIKVNNYAVETFEFVAQPGVNIIKVPNPVLVEAGKSLAIEIETPKTKGSIVAVDTGPGVTKHGDLIRRSGGWMSASQIVNVSLNMSLGYVKDKNPQLLQKAKLKVIKTGQRNVTLSWGSTDVGVEKWVVTVKANNTDKEVTLEYKDPTAILINKLLPATLYTATVYSVYGDQKSDPESCEFATEGLTAPFAAMTLSSKNPTIGQRVTLGITNTPQDVASVTWEINGGISKGQGEQFTFSVTNEMTEILARVQIKYADGTQEAIVRKIMVK